MVKVSRELEEQARKDRAATLEYATVKRWLKHKTPDTQMNYLTFMVAMVKRSGRNPDEFLSWARSVDPVEVADLIDTIGDTYPGGGSQVNFKMEMRSFLRANGFNDLPKANLRYTLKDWHRAYKKEEIRSLKEFLDDKLEKFYVYAAVETGFRAQTILDLKWKHISQDFETGKIPVAIRLGPEFYNKKKSAGFTFLGLRSVTLLRQLIEEGRVKKEPEAPLLGKEYPVVWKVLNLARKKAKIDPKVQLSHGFRKYYEGALDSARLDPDVKTMLEGHFASVRAKHYTGREWDELRPQYQKAYPWIDLDRGDPETEAKISETASKVETVLSESQAWQEERTRLLRRIDELEKKPVEVPESVKQEIIDSVIAALKKKPDNPEDKAIVKHWQARIRKREKKH